MIERTERFDLKPEYLAADMGLWPAETLNWIVNEKKIAPHIPVIDKSKREDGTFSVNDDQLLYRASKLVCDVCPFKLRCCPKEPARKIPRSI
jgi:hypothetical protein